MVEQLTDLVEQLLFSLWAELGAPGGGRRHRHIVLDPEPLLVFTPFLARNDNRLMGLAFDWCLQNAGHLSPSRIQGLSRTLSPMALERLKRFNGTLALKGVSFQPQGEPLTLEPDRLTMALPIERGALVAFRVRAVAGVSTRADVLCRLLFSPATGMTTAELAPSGTTRRAVEGVLTELTEAGLVKVHGSPRRRHFVLDDLASFTRFVRAEGLLWWNWHGIFTLIESLQPLKDIARHPDRVQLVETVKLRNAVAPLVFSLGLPQPPQLDQSDEPLRTLMTWALAIVDQFANPPTPRQQHQDLETAASAFPGR
jgi:hypothetical protein